MYRVDEDNNIIVETEDGKNIEITQAHALYRYLMGIVDADERLRYTTENPVGRSYRTRRSAVEKARQELSKLVERTAETFRHADDGQMRNVVNVLASEFLQYDADYLISNQLQEQVNEVIENYTDSQTQTFTVRTAQLSDTIDRIQHVLEPMGNKIFHAFDFWESSNEMNAKEKLQAFGIDEKSDYYPYFIKQQISLQALEDIQIFMEDVGEFRPDIRERAKEQIAGLLTSVRGVIANRYLYYNTLKKEDSQKNPLKWKKVQDGHEFIQDLSEQDLIFKKRIIDARFDAQTLLRTGIWNTFYNIDGKEIIFSEERMMDSLAQAKEQLDKIKNFDKELQEGTYEKNQIEPTLKTRFTLNEKTKKKLKAGLAVALTGITLTHAVPKLTGVNVARSTNRFPSASAVQYMIPERTPEVTNGIEAEAESLILKENDKGQEEVVINVPPSVEEEIPNVTFEEEKEQEAPPASSNVEFASPQAGLIVEANTHSKAEQAVDVSRSTSGSGKWNEERLE